MKLFNQLLSKHLLLSITIFFTAGIGLGPTLRLDQNSLLPFLITLFLVLAGTTLLYLFRLYSSLPFLLPLLAFLFGIFRISGALQVPQDDGHIYNKISTTREAVFVGTMEKMATFNNRTSSTVIDLNALRFKENKYFQPVSGKIKVTLKSRWPQSYRPGDRLAIRAKLKVPQSFNSPGSFDYSSYLARKGIWVTAFIRSPNLIKNLETERTFIDSLRYLPEIIRTEIANSIDSTLPPKKAALYRALLLGDRSGISHKTLEFFKASGTMHILAISGLHLAVVSGLLYFLLYYLLSRSEKLLLRFSVRKIAVVACFPLILFYGLLAGMNTPITRAVVMAAVIILAVTMQRQKSSPSLIATAILVLLFFDPLQLFTVSFQLSFCAVCAILLVIPLLRDNLISPDKETTRSTLPSTCIRWLTAALIVSTVATFCTAPISLYSFHRISTVGPLANILVEPFLCFWALPFGLISIPFSSIAPLFSKHLLIIGSYGIDGALWVVKLISSFNYASIWLPTPPILLIVLFYTMIAFVIFYQLRGYVSLILISAMFLVFILLTGFPGVIAYHGNENRSYASFINVGQGSSTYLQFTSGKRILIDGGGSSYSKISVGETVIAPYLWSQGIDSLDGIILTHPDADHFNGLPFIIKHFNPKVLWVSTLDKGGKKYSDLLRLAKNNGVAIVVPPHNTLFQNLTGGDSLECLYNFQKPDEGQHHLLKKKRNSGLVLKACLNQNCILFPGDIGKHEEAHLVKKRIDLTAPLLLAAHHGSKYSNSSDFLRAVEPQRVVVSAGNNSRYFPHNSLKRKCDQEEIILLSTNKAGTIEFHLEGQKKKFFKYSKYNNNPLYSLEKTGFP